MVVKLSHGLQCLDDNIEATLDQESNEDVRYEGGSRLKALALCPVHFFNIISPLHRIHLLTNRILLQLSIQNNMSSPALHELGGFGRIDQVYVDQLVWISYSH